MIVDGLPLSSLYVFFLPCVVEPAFRRMHHSMVSSKFPPFAIFLLVLHAKSAVSQPSVSLCIFFFFSCIICRKVLSV